MSYVVIKFTKHVMSSTEVAVSFILCPTFNRCGFFTLADRPHDN